jgi:hypothetical protein
VQRLGPWCPAFQRKESWGSLRLVVRAKIGLAPVWVRGAQLSKGRKAGAASAWGWRRRSAWLPLGSVVPSFPKEGKLGQPLLGGGGEDRSGPRLGSWCPAFQRKESWGSLCLVVPAKIGLAPVGFVVPSFPKEGKLGQPSPGEDRPFPNFSGGDGREARSLQHLQARGSRSPDSPPRDPVRCGRPRLRRAHPAGR